MKTERAAPLKGYARKPRAITVIALIFFLMPAAMMLQVWCRAGGSWRVVGEVLRSDYVLQEWGLSWSAALAVYLVSRISFVYFAGLSLYVLVTKLSRLAISPQLETPWSLLITGTWVGVVVYCFWSSLAAPYLHPRLRWWTRPPRISLCQEASIVYQGTMIPVTVLNLSRGGAFVRVEDATAEGSAMPRRLGETCRIAMTLGRADQPASDSERFESSAQLVWRGAPETPYRNGLGIKFASLSRSQRHRLNRYLQAFREAECLQPPAKT